MKLNKKKIVDERADAYEENPSILSSLAKRPTAIMPQNPPNKGDSIKFETLSTDQSHGRMLLQLHHPPLMDLDLQ